LAGPSAFGAELTEEFPFAVELLHSIVPSIDNPEISCAVSGGAGWGGELTRARRQIGFGLDYPAGLSP